LFPRAPRADDASLDLPVGRSAVGLPAAELAGCCAVVVAAAVAVAEVEDAGLVWLSATDYVPVDAVVAVVAVAAVVAICGSLGILKADVAGTADLVDVAAAVGVGVAAGDWDYL
jgi:hypothetical protein